MNFPQSIRPHLENLQITGNHVVITAQLDRTTYQNLNKVLEVIGGKWSRKEKAHVFEQDPTEDIEQVILTGKYSSRKTDFQQFYTPLAVAAQIRDLADIHSGQSVLEPSAGEGALLNVLPPDIDVTVFEIDPKNQKKLHDACQRFHTYDIYGTDFLSMNPGVIEVDRVVMNPPFTRQQDIQHVRHAFKFLKPGGKLVSVMSVGVTFRSNRLSEDFRSFAAELRGTYQDLPWGTFASSGTNVQTLLFSITKP